MVIHSMKNRMRASSLFFHVSVGAEVFTAEIMPAPVVTAENGIEGADLLCGDNCGGLNER